MFALDKLKRENLIKLSTDNVEEFKEWNDVVTKLFPFPGF